MRILFLAHYVWPHIGGVETHVMDVAKNLKLKTNNEITILTEQYDKNIKNTETKDEVKIIRFKYPHIKFLGLLYIWFWLFKNCNLIEKSDIIHIHDVFIWYFPFKFIYPNKPVYTTIHGLEWDNPLSFISIWQKRLAVKFSTGTIGVGKFLEKYLQVKFDKILYGAG